MSTPYNNSDDESPPLPKPPNDDFVSFPTIPDPEQERKGTLKRIFTQTIRKVTTNATQLVPNYGTLPRPSDYETKTDDIDVDNVSELEFSRLPPPLSSPPTHSTPAAESEGEGEEHPVVTPMGVPITSTPSVSTPLGPPAGPPTGLPMGPPMGPPAGPPMGPQLGPGPPLVSPIGTSMTKPSPSIRQATQPPSSLALKFGPPLVLAPAPPTIGGATSSFSLAPRVTSDNRTLRLSLFQATPNPVNSATLTLANITVSLYTKPERKPTLTRDISLLQNKITLIFNNLPNDIELSDDDDDLDDGLEITKGNESTVPTEASNEPTTTEAISSPELQVSESRPLLVNLYLDSIARELRIKVSHGITSTIPGHLPLLLLFYALKNKDVKKKQLNLLTLLIDNAKNIISATATKRRKTKAKSLHNPLKSGGIPKKYWINDAFVLDCLNCFKPFTAFRRKHHCRFCGQIFCLECTSFILYNQHRDERRRRHAIAEGNPPSPTDHKVYVDKLRVCKPCLLDVIVYLSDDLTDEDEDNENIDNDAAELESISPPSTVVLSAAPVSLRETPQMAIPVTRRRGEAVEIPVTKLLLPRQPLGLFNPLTLSELTPTARHHRWYPENNNFLRVPDNLRMRQTLALKLRMQQDDADLVYSLTAESTAPRGSVTPGGAAPDSDLLLELEQCETEDERAMLVYQLLMFPGPTTVPTLREFPGTADSFPRYPVELPGTPQPVGVPPPPHPPSATKLIHFDDTPVTRLSERAHALLLRMRRRRRLRSLRNVLILTQQNYRLPSFEMRTPLPPMRKASVSSPLPRLKFAPVTPTPATPLVSSSVDELPILPTPKLPLRRRLEVPLSPLDRDGSQELADIEDNSLFDDDNDLVVAPAVVPYDYQLLIDAMIVQCLDDCDVTTNHHQWLRVINSSLDYVNFIKLTDTLDIRQYVKIKKLLGSKIDNTKVIDGLFFTKNVDLKKMPLHIELPKIVLLMFPLEYLKHKQQFISLRMIHSQQQVYITNLVQRLILLEPDVVVVGDTVCGLAEQLLEEANITVLSNCKPQIIERILRYTKADIYQLVNDLFFKKGQVGTCALFDIQWTQYGGVAKPFAYFTGVDIANGFTVALRGGNDDTLNGAKYATESVLSGVLNVKFERLFFNDHAIVRGDHYAPGVGVVDPKITSQLQAVERVDLGEISLDHTEVVEYIRLFAKRLITLLPAVHFGLPDPLVRVVDAFYDYFQYNEVHTQIEALGDDDVVPEYLMRGININEYPNGSRDIINITKYSLEVKLKQLIAEYQVRARTWQNLLLFSTYQLYPMYHRQIHVLHLTVLIKHATPCTGPNLLVVDYYTDNDKCFGIFLDMLFQESFRICSECGDPMINHYNSYVHGHQKLTLVVEKVNDTTARNQRVMWSYCHECDAQTPVVPMHDETYYLLVGKFLELAFYGKDVRAPGCDHDFFRHYTRYYGLNDMVIRLENAPIDTYEVVVPKKQLEDVPKHDFDLKVNLYHKITEKLTDFFDSVNSRLVRVKLDTFDSPEEGEAQIKQMKEKVAEQRLKYHQRLKELYDESSPTNFLLLNKVLREVQKVGVDWDAEFSQFEQAYLPLENDVNKITQFHLRNFLNKLEDESDTAPGAQDMPMLNEETTKEIGDLIPSSLYDPAKSSFRDKQLLWQDRINSTTVEVPAPPPLLKKELDALLGPSAPGNTRVQQLTLFFDQMNIDQISHEFRKQREREMKRRADKYPLAQPVQQLMPIVEVYDNIDDAVEPGVAPNEASREKEQDEATAQEKDTQRNVESLFKQLSTFWNDRTATSWEPLAYPLDSHEHTFEDLDVIVREDEPLSLVAFCLLTANYRDKLDKMGEETKSGLPGFDLEKTELNLKKIANFAKLERKFKNNARELAGQVLVEERVMCQLKLNHIKYKLEDGLTTFSCKIFYLEQFEAFRNAILGLLELFVQLLLRCVKWNSKGGKLKLSFLKTLDDRYIVKELSKSELELFVLIAPFYFKYSSQTVFNNLSTALAKIFGFYQVEIVNKKGTFRMDFLIMENLFHNHNPTRIFDLKGLMRNRHVEQTGKADEVLLDENMIEYIYESPVFVGEHLKKLMRGSLFNDTLFLLAMDVMDYSLVVGIDDPLQKLYIGIIDWLRAFTWDKKVENWVKGNLGGTKQKGKDPTVVTPKQYKNRFREAMERYILEVPDIWYEGKR